MKLPTFGQTIVAGTLLLSSLAASAADKIGAVDIRSLMAAAPQTVAADEAFKSEFIGRERELNNRQQDLKASLEKLAARKKRESVGLTPAQAQAFRDEMYNAEKAINRQAEDLKRDVEDMQQEAARRQQELTIELQRKVMAHVNRYASDNNYDLVVAEGVLYASKKIDITEAVLDKMKKEFESK